MSASENTESGMNGEFTHAMSSEEVSEMIQFFTKAAIHVRTGWFSRRGTSRCSFIFDLPIFGQKTNRRTDKWGGDIVGT